MHFCLKVAHKKLIWVVSLVCCEGSGKACYILLHLSQVDFLPEVDELTSSLLSCRHDVGINQDNNVIAVYWDTLFL